MKVPPEIEINIVSIRTLLSAINNPMITPTGEVIEKRPMKIAILLIEKSVRLKAPPSDIAAAVR